MKRMRTLGSSAMAAFIGMSSVLFQGCPFSGPLNDCFGEGTISESEYDDLNIIEQLIYDENSCGRYEQRFDLDN